jgi:hypothetical protein
MAIPLFSRVIERRRVGFVGDMPEDAVQALEDRGYDPYPLTAAELYDDGILDTTGSIVLTQSAADLQGIYKVLRNFADALTHDCRIYVRHANDPTANGKAALLHFLGTLELPASGFREDERPQLLEPPGGESIPVYAPFVHIVEVPGDGVALANTIAVNPPNHPPNKTLEIEVTNAKGAIEPLSPERELLVQRAFWNCKLVRLFEKSDGLSTARAYEGFAYHGENIVAGEWPYRVMVKIGPRRDVAREYYKYRNIFLENVPFHLGPRLRLDRCVLGRSCGLIVSDFVANAQTIRDVARKGRGAAAIASLFNVTLVAWRRAAKENRDLRLNEFLADTVLGERTVPAHREARMSRFGSKKPLSHLVQAIRGAATGDVVLTGMVHGDLHATNVLVRMHDAVIIDLERIEQGWPLLFDTASLEAGLFIDGFIKDKRSPKALLMSVARLYRREAFDHDDHHCDPSDPSAWFFECARQIRMQAGQIERSKYQYAWVLAAVFIKKACQDKDFANGKAVAFNRVPANANVGREAIRQLAYVIGENIVTSLKALKETPQ